MPSVSIVDVGVADRLAELPGEQRQILVHRLPEERLDALEAVFDDLAHVGGGIRRVGADHGSDADVEQILSWASCIQMTMSTRRPASALSIAPNTIASERMLSRPTVSGSLADADGRDEVARGRRNGRRRGRPAASGGGSTGATASNRPSRAPAATTSIRICIGAVPGQRALRRRRNATRIPRTCPGRPRTRSRGRRRRRRSRVRRSPPPTSPGGTRNAAGSIPGNRRPRRAEPGHAAHGVEAVDRHVEQQDMIHLLAKAAEMRREKEVGVNAGDLADRAASAAPRAMRRTPAHDSGGSARRRGCGPRPWRARRDRAPRRASRPSAFRSAHGSRRQGRRRRPRDAPTARRRRTGDRDGLRREARGRRAATNASCSENSAARAFGASGVEIGQADDAQVGDFRGGLRARLGSSRHSRRGRLSAPSTLAPWLTFRLPRRRIAAP